MTTLSPANRVGGATREFVRHRGPVTAVAGIPGSRAVVSSAYDGAVARFDFGSGAVELLGYHDHLANKITVNAAGSLAASSSSDYSVNIWDLGRGSLARRLIAHSDDVEDFAFVDDHLGVSVSRDCRILVWDLDSGAVLRAIEGHEKDVLSVNCVGDQIFTSGDDMTLRVWDLRSGELLRTWGPFDQETDSCAVDPIHRRAVLGCDDGVVRIFALDSGKSVAEIAAHASGIKRVAVSPVSGDILSAAYDQRLLVWDAESLDLKAELDSRPTTWERSINWSPDGAEIIAGTFDGTVLHWDSRSGRCLGELGERGAGNACLNDVSANAAGEFATVSDDGRVRLGHFQAANATWLSDAEPTTGPVLANAVVLDDKHGLVAAGCHDQKVVLFDKLDGSLRPRWELPLGEGPINCLRVAQSRGCEGQIFAACYSGAVVCIGPEAEILSRARPHDGAVKALRLHPEDRRGVSCCAGGSLRSWNFAGEILHDFPGHLAIVDDVDIDPSGKLIASVSRDFTMNVYDLSEGRLLRSFSLGRRSPKAVCFFDSDSVIVSNYWGSLTRFDWRGDTVVSRCIAENGISSLSRAGDHLIAVSYDGGAYLVRPSDLRVVGELRGMRQRLVPSPLITPAAVEA